MRIAKAYFTTIKEVYKWWGAGEIRKSSSIDYQPLESINIDLLCKQMNKGGVQIRSSTFFSLLHSLFDPIDGSIWGFTSECMEKKRRRYCPKCISKENIYYLYWQIKEIDICHKHLIYLEDSCLKCNQPLPYVGEGLADGVCPKCQFRLYQIIRSCINEKEIRHQVFLHSQWEELLYREHINTTNLSKGRYLAVKLLYISQNFEPQMVRGRIPLSSDIISGLTSYIRSDIESKKIYTVTLQFIRRVLQDNGVTVRKFYDTKVPSTYIESILEEKTRKTNVGSCLAPWCSSFGNNTGMLPIRVHKSHKNKYTLRNQHMCKFCSLKYGFLKDGEWIEKDGIISASFVGVPLLNAKYRLKDFADQLKISRYIASLFIAYFIRYKLVNSEVINKYKLFKEIENPLPYFQLLSEEKGIQVFFARKKFNWSQREYYFYYFDPQVQLFLNDDSKHTKLKINDKSNGIEHRQKLKLREKKDIKEVSWEEKNHIWRKADRIILEAKTKKIRLSNDNFFHELGRGAKWIKSQMPELINWYIQRKEEVTQINKIETERIRLENAITAICKLYKEGVSISHQRITEETGIERKYYRVHSLTTIMNSIIYDLYNSKITVYELEVLLQQNKSVEDWKSIFIKHLA